MGRKINEEEMYTQLGKRIRDVRTKKGFTQENLAHAVSTNPSHISNIENNRTHVSLPLLIDIGHALNISIDYLLSDQYPTDNGFLEKEILIELQTASPNLKVTALQIIKLLKDSPLT